MVYIREKEEIKRMMQELPLEKRRIISIVAHINHGKSTMTDHLLARAGMMSKELAGEERETDYDEEEQERMITIFTSVVNLLYKFNGEQYLFSLNDTPGHISFTGEVSRAIRSSDGICLLIDAVEGVMTQTVTNLTLGLQEGAKPILFINKADRLISELRYTPKEFANKIDKIVREVNDIIEDNAPEELKEDWKVNFKDGSVAFGSALDGWGVSRTILEENYGSLAEGIKEIFERYEQNDVEWLREHLPLHEVILEMTIKHLPDPKSAQALKLDRIWQGDKDLDSYKQMQEVDENGPLVGTVSKIFVDPRNFRTTQIGRVWSGTLHKDEELYLLSRGSTVQPKRVGFMEITELIDSERIPAGNMFAATGFSVPAGESFVASSFKDEYEDLIKKGKFSFEPIQYASEPVVRRRIKPKNPQDIAKLGKVAELWVKSDPTADFYLDEESKTYELMGIDPLQIEILVGRIQQKVPIEVSDPITVYRERIKRKGRAVKTKSPNGHNRIELFIEPLDEDVIQALKNEKIRMAQDEKERARKLREEFGWSTDHARGLTDINGTNVLINAIKGTQRFRRVKDYVISTFSNFCNNAILAKEPAQGLKVVLTDTKIHEDPRHTQMNQMFPMTHAALSLSFLDAKPALYEPVLKANIKVPQPYMGDVTSLLQKHRGRIRKTDMKGKQVEVVAHIPASETIGLAERMRSATEGKAFFGYEPSGWQEVPEELARETIMEIRERKGEKKELPKFSDFDRFVYQRT